MTTKPLAEFFFKKQFQVPPYQRDYAWRRENIDDLFDDLTEAMDMGSQHYLGTFILARSEGSAVHQVVDGQQRLTTLTILLDALVDAVDDEKTRIIFESQFIENFGQKKFSVLGVNQQFFDGLLSEKTVLPTSEGQRRLLDAYEWIRQRVAVLKATGQESVVKWLCTIGDLEVMEFVTENQGRAIRMFQSVNDRGVRLSNMDIAKSLLIYYSNRFLSNASSTSGVLDDFIAEQFGAAFRDYSAILQLAGENGFKVKNVDRAAFCEDDILRFHYLAFNAGDDVPFDWAATTAMVLNDFLKVRLKRLRDDPPALHAFIERYVVDVAAFFGTLRELLERTRSDRRIYLLFVVGDLSATLYPLTIRLAQRKLLDAVLPSGKSLLDWIEVADIRVFKLWGTNPQADVYRLTHASENTLPEEIALGLRQLVEKFLPDARMEDKLTNDNLYRNPALPRILTALEEDQRKTEIPLQKLVDLVRQGQTVEHLLPQSPTFGLRNYGFRTGEHYESNINRLGNLTLLERDLNSRCSNQSPEAKVARADLYTDSAYWMTRAIAATHMGRSPVFSLDDINRRGGQLAQRCVELWPSAVEQNPTPQDN